MHLTYSPSTSPVLSTIKLYSESDHSHRLQDYHPYLIHHHLSSGLLRRLLAGLPTSALVPLLPFLLSSQDGLWTSHTDFIFYHYTRETLLATLP